MIFMNGAGSPIPSSQFVKDRSPDPDGAKTAKGGTLGHVVSRGCPEVTEHPGTLKIVPIQMAGKLGSTSAGEAARPWQGLKNTLINVTHIGLLMCYHVG